MSTPKLLIIDDDETIIFSFKTFLNKNNFKIEYSKNGKDGLEKLGIFKPNLVIADYKMPEMTGLEFIKASKIITPSTPVIVMSAYGDSNTKRIFFDEGAFDYVEKPFDIEEIINLINKALRTSQSSDTPIEVQPYIGKSDVILNLFDNIDKITGTDITVLIEGESGTGKDIIANYIHSNSPFSESPFISINCAAIPENLIESELFGYEKGSFTGADEQKIGKFELAKNGTLFLDEIGELSLTIQAKLLRVLQNKTIERIGSVSSIKSNARIVAATNKNLFNMVKKGLFREDLYYRLTTFPIEVPPLRNRGNDVIIIAEYLLKKYCLDFNKAPKTLMKCASLVFKNYYWPGNVRELQNIISRIVIIEPNQSLYEKDILPYFESKNQKSEVSEISFLAEYTEKELLKIHADETLKLCNYNKSEAAKKIGINYRTLIKRLKD